APTKGTEGATQAEGVRLRGGADHRTGQVTTVPLLETFAVTGRCRAGRFCASRALGRLGQYPRQGQRKASVSWKPRAHPIRTTRSSRKRNQNAQHSCFLSSDPLSQLCRSQYRKEEMQPMMCVRIRAVAPQGTVEVARKAVRTLMWDRAVAARGREDGPDLAQLAHLWTARPRHSLKK